MRARDYAGRKAELLPAVLESFASSGARRRYRRWSRARAARPRSTCAPATSPTWASPRPPMCRSCWSATSTAAASSPASSARTRCSSRPSAPASAASSINKFRGDPTAVRRRRRGDRARAPAGRASASCRGSPTRARLPAEDAVGLGAERRAARGDHGSRCRCCRASPISTTSTRSAPSRTCELVLRRPGEAASGRCRSRPPAGLEIDHRRSRGRCARQGWDIDIARAPPPRRPRARPLRRLPDARPDDRRSRRHRRAGRHGRRARPARRRRPCSTADKTTARR